MASYPNHKDTFDSDLGIFSIVTTAGTSVLADGKRTNDKPADAWNTNGIFHGTSKRAVNGDGCRVRISINEVDDAAGYVVFYFWDEEPPAFSPGTPNSGLARIKAFFYPDGGIMKLHGVSGLSGDVTLDEPIIPGAELEMIFSWNPSNGKLAATVEGGNWSTPTTFLTEVNDCTGTYDWSFQAQAYSANGAWSIYDYQWYDLNGPSDDEPTLGPVEGVNISYKLGSKIGI